MPFLGEGIETPVRLLLVEDNPGDARLFREMLDPNEFTVHHSEDLTGALVALANGSFHVVLLDLGLPDSSGLDTLRQASSHDPGAPVIVVLTGNDDEQVAVDAVRAGAQDYLVKGRLDVEVLLRSIRYALERHHLQRALEQARLESEVTRQRDFYAALTEVGDLTPGVLEPGDAALDDLRQSYQKLAGAFINERSGSRSRQEVRSFAVQAAGLRVRARHIVSCHLRVLREIENELSGPSLGEITANMRLLLVEVLGNVMDIYLSVYRVMQPSEHHK